jgi:hypothetical protein
MSRIVWFDSITKRDARKLVKWWHRFSPGQFLVERSETNRRLWAVVRHT